MARNKKHSPPTCCFTFIIEKLRTVFLNFSTTDLFTFYFGVSFNPSGILLILRYCRTVDTVDTVDDSISFHMRNDIKKAVGCLSLSLLSVSQQTPGHSWPGCYQRPHHPVRPTTEWDYCYGGSFIAN